MSKVRKIKAAQRRTGLDAVWGKLAERPAGRLLASLRKADDHFGRVLNGVADFTAPQRLIVAAQKGSELVREAVAHHGEEDDHTTQEILDALSVQTVVQTTAVRTADSLSFELRGIRVVQRGARRVTNSDGLVTCEQIDDEPSELSPSVRSSSADDLGNDVSG